MDGRFISIGARERMGLGLGARAHASSSPPSLTRFCRAGLPASSLESLDQPSLSLSMSAPNERKAKATEEGRRESRLSGFVPSRASWWQKSKKCRRHDIFEVNRERFVSCKKSFDNILRAEQGDLSLIASPNIIRGEVASSYQKGRKEGRKEGRKDGREPW